MIRWFARQPPIFIAGIPRSGTTWIASVLGATAGTAYFHEPFNFRNVPESAPFRMRYRRATDEDAAYAAYCRRCFAGRQRLRIVMSFQQKWRRRLPFNIGRVLIKDVHSAFALDWIHHHIGPQIIIALRHPAAVADSWFRVFGEKNAGVLDLFLGQPALMEDHLQPFEAHLRSAGDFWTRVGAYWGACCHVMLRQQQNHPEWLVVRHEDFCEDPEGRFRDLCARLGLRWTKRTDQRLRISTTEDSGKPYVPKRIPADEKEKWRRNLTASQIEGVARGVAPFGSAGYSF